MKRKLLSFTLILALLMTSAVCAYASKNESKNNSGKSSVTTTSSDQIDAVEKVKKDIVKAQPNLKERKEYLIEKRKQIQAGYTVQERSRINAAGEAIKNEDPKAKVLGIDSVISNKANFKFDTPPVIKDGRTLIPVRAITQGFGAELTYDQESQLVTITKGDTVIETNETFLRC